MNSSKHLRGSPRLLVLSVTAGLLVCGIPLMSVQAQTPLSPRQFVTAEGAWIEDAIASDVLAACAGELAAWRADEAVVTMDRAGRPYDNSGRVQESLERLPWMALGSDPDQLEARVARDSQYRQSNPLRSSGDAQSDAVRKASYSQGDFNTCAWKRRAAQLRGTAFPLDKPAVADAGSGPLNLRDLPVTATVGKSPAAPKARPSPPTITIVTNSGTACFTVTLSDVELVDQDTQWRFQYNLLNKCSTTQLYIAEEKRAGEKPAQPGVFELPVLNGGSWFNWTGPGLAPGLAFQPSDPRGSSGPPVESQGVRTGTVFRNVTEKTPIYIWLASCAAYSADNFSMILFKAATSLAEDPRIQCVSMF